MCVPDGGGNCWKRRCRGSRASEFTGPSPLHLNSFRMQSKRVTRMSFTEQGDGSPGWCCFSDVGRGYILRCYMEETGCWARGEPQRLPHSTPQALARLTGPPEEFGSWPEIPALDLGRCEGGSANLAAALGVWQTRDFSSALCSAKLKMCLARNPSLIFKPLCVFFLRKCDPHVFDLFLFNSSNRIRSCNDEWEQC